MAAVCHPRSRANRAAALAWAVSVNEASRLSCAGSASNGSVDDTEISGTLPAVTCRMAWFTSKKAGPKMAVTSSSSSSWATRPAVSGSPSMSRITISTGRPSTPPTQLTNSTKYPAAWDPGMSTNPPSSEKSAA